MMKTKRSKQIIFLVVIFLFQSMITTAQNKFIDKRNNKSYNIINIGSQTWFQKDLDYKTNNSWYYDDNMFNSRLYQWEVACNTCPDGWHLPTNKEWEELFVFLDAGAKKYDEKYFVVANKLKKDSKSNWIYKKNGKIITENSNNLNSSRFSALPAGLRDGNGNYYMQGSQAIFWSSSYKKDYHYFYQLTINSPVVEKKKTWEPVAYSVRCIKNPPILENGLILNKLLTINSYSELIKNFGDINIENHSNSYTYWDESKEAEIEVFSYSSTLYPNSILKVEFKWKNDNYSELEEITINTPNSPWKSAEGVSIGISLKELERINTKPFLFYCFDMDMIPVGSISDFQNGKLNASTTKVTFKYNEKYSGIGFDPILSNSEIVKDNDLFVGEISIKRP